jgi:uncharacterized protein YecT (DUF1311 family)
VTSIAAVIAAGPAHAQSANAEALFDEGNRLIASGKVAEACEAFEASNRAEPRAGTLLHLGACRELNHQLASAWSAYKDALARAKDPDKRKLAAAQVAALEPRLSYLTVSVSAHTEGLTVLRNGASFDPGSWNRPLPVDGGEYVIVGRARGHKDWQTTAHVATEHDQTRVEVPRLEPVAASASPSAPSGALTTRRKIAIGVASAGSIAAAAGVVLGLATNRDKNDAFTVCPDPMFCTRAPQANALLASGRNRALEANIAFGVAAVSVATAAVLWFTGAPESADPGRMSIIPNLKPGEMGIVLARRF